MSLEVEAKIKVADHTPIRERLRELGGRFVSQVLESNHIFDAADGSLLSSGCGLRVRHCREGQGEVPAAAMTYKGPVQASRMKKREEIETPVSDPEAAIGILTSLGYREAVRFEKRRETWRLEGLQIELDEVPYLGCFMEVEGPDEQTIHAMLTRLDLAQAEPIRESYIALLVNHCREQHLPADQITFQA